MSIVSVAGGASTQSRARRPLPPGALSGRTFGGAGVREHVAFRYPDKPETARVLTSYVLGQWGGIWGIPSRETMPAYLWGAIRTADGLGAGSYGHAQEYALAEALGNVYDGLLTTNDLAVRYFSNGSDACSAALRLARAATARDGVAVYGYHGAHSEWAQPPQCGGVLGENIEYQSRFEFGDRASLNMALDSSPAPACIMLEVPAIDDEELIRSFLQFCRAECDRRGIPLIIDDVVLGFRVALGGSPEYYGVKPDIVVLGKAMSAAGGVAAVLGDAKLVNQLNAGVFYSTTFGGNAGPCAVAAATLIWLLENRLTVYGASNWPETNIKYHDGNLWRIGSALKDGLNAVFTEQGRAASVVGQPERSILVFDEGEEARRAWCGEMIARGFMLDRPQYASMAHSMADVEATIAAARSIP